MRRVGDLCHSLSALPIIDEELVIRADTEEVIATWGELNILHKFRVRFDGLVVLERYALVEDDASVVSGCCSSERTLMTDGHRVNDLKNGTFLNAEGEGKK